MRKTFSIILALVVLMGSSLILSITSIAYAVPQGFNVQGRLTDSNGVNRNGSYSISFTIYDSAIGGTALWTKTFPSIAVTNGNFQVNLNDPADVPGQTLPGILTGDPRFLEMDVLAGQPSNAPAITTPEPPLVPRQQLLSSPYSIKAGAADSASSAASASTAGGLSGPGPILITVAGSEKARADANGIGIGTNGSTILTPLHVVGPATGAITISDGNQAAGKVLTSDPQGKGTWQTIPTSTRHYAALTAGNRLLNFTISASAFTPPLRANTTVIPVVEAHMTLLGFAIGTCKIVDSYNQPGTPFNGNQGGTGLYFNVHINDVIQLGASGECGDIAVASFVIVAETNN